MSNAGTAYIDIEGDWTGFNRQYSRQTGELTRRIARDGASISKQFSDIGSNAGRRLASRLTDATKIGVAGGAAGIAAVLGASEHAAADFEQELSNVGAASNATAKQLDQLRSSAIQAGAKTKFSALEAAQAQAELAKGGLSVQQILTGGLNSALALAAAGELDLADAAKTTVNAMKLFKIPGKDSIKVADGFATAANRTTADVSDFALALEQGGSAAKTAGLTFTETTAALEAMADVGIKGSDAGTSLKTALVQLASPTSKKAVELAKKLGLNFFDAHGQIKSLVDISATLQKSFHGLTSEQRLQAATTLVGQDGFRALLSLYDAGPKKIASYETELSKSGTAAEVAKKKQDNLKGSLEQLHGSAETLGIEVGSAMIPAIRKGADELTHFTNQITGIADDKNLTFAAKFERAFDLVKLDTAPFVHKLERSIEDADIPGHVAHELQAATQALNGGNIHVGSDVTDKLIEQLRDAHLGDRVSELISAAAPKIAHAAGEAAVGAAGTFVSGFVHADAWGKLVLTAWFLKKFGGLGAFTLIGKRAGTAMQAGFATNFVGPTATTGVVGAATTIGGRQTASQKRLTTGRAEFQSSRALGANLPRAAASAAPAVVGGAAGIAGSAALSTVGGPIGAGVLSAAILLELEQEKRIKQSEKNVQALQRVNDVLEQALPDPHKFQVASDAIDLLNGRLNTGTHDLKGMQAALDAMGLSVSSKPAQIKGAADAIDHLRERFAVTQALLKKGVNIPVDTPIAAAKDVQNALEEMSKHSSASIKDLQTNIRLNTRLIKNSLGNDSAAGKEAISANFSAAIANVKNSMAAGTVTVKDGTAEIKRLMIDSLKNFGFSEKQAISYSEGRDPLTGKNSSAALVGKATGGMVMSGGHATVPGLGSGDKVHLQAMVEPGEEVFVLNRNANRKRKSLQALNAAIPRFQTGGSVTGDTDFLPEMMHALQALSAAAHQSIFVQSGRRTVAEQLAQGPSTPGHPVAGPNGPHVRGIAADITPGYSVFGKLASKFGLGFTVMPQEPWHIQLINAAMAAAGAVAAAAPKLAKLTATGPDSALKGIVQGSLDTTHGAAQHLLDTIAQSIAPETGESVVADATASGNGADLMRQISKQRGWNFNDWWALDGSETSHGANTVNPTSTARLRGQFLDFNYGKFGPGSDPAQHPSMAQQIESMADYIAARYGNPTAAWAYHRANNFYAQGGLVELKKGGAPAKGNPITHAGIDLSGALKKISAGKSEKLRSAASTKLVDTINAIGFPAQASLLQSLESNADLYGEYADRASSLTDSDVIEKALENELARRQALTPPPNPLFPDDAQQAIVDQLLGRVNGKTQLDWLTSQLGALFDWRNTITDTDPIVLSLKDDTVQLLAEAQKQLDAVTDQLKATEKKIKDITAKRDQAAKLEDKRHDQIKTEMDKPAKDRNNQRIAAWRQDYLTYHSEHIGYNAELANLRGQQRGQQALQDSLSNDVVPALTSKRDDLDQSHNDLLSNLIDVQGLGGPLTRLATLPPIGALGGKIFDTEQLIKQLTDHPPRVDASTTAPTETDSQRADLLQGLLDEAHLRTTVSEAAFSVFKGADGLLPPYGGSFSEGGTVPGARGEARTIIAHGGEQILSLDDLNSGRGGDVIHVHQHKIYLGGRELDAKIDSRVETVTRTQARRGARLLPGGSGGGIR